jgi:protein TonB
VQRLPKADGGAGTSDADAVFSAADLDQQPRPIFQPAPEYPAELRRNKIEGTVQILFIVDRTGSVVNPIVQKSSNPALERPALQAVRRWRFDPGKRQGQAVPFRMRVPVSFNSR